MYICICNAVTEKDIHQAVGQGVCSLEGLSEVTGVSRDCGSCMGHACQALEKAIASHQKVSSLPMGDQ